MAIPNQPMGQPVEHRNANAVLALGVVSVLCCGAIGPVAWAMGKKALSEIDRSGGAIGGRIQVMIGYILGVIGTVLMIVFAILSFLIVIGGHA